MEIKAMFDPGTSTLTYLVYDHKTKDAVIIDPVLDFNEGDSTVNFKSIDRIISYVHDKNLKIHYILETHAHADHLTGARVLVKDFFPEAKVAIGSGITKVQESFGAVFGIEDTLKTDGSQFDLLLRDEEMFNAGSLSIRTISTPGHTPACVSYLVEDSLFVGDALFMPDAGTGRCDFPLGSAHDLYDSVTNKIYSLPDNIKIFVGHDYQPNHRELKYQTTVGESKQRNMVLDDKTSELDFVSFRNRRDGELVAPKLLYPSIQINIAAGQVQIEDASNSISLYQPILASPNGRTNSI